MDELEGAEQAAAISRASNASKAASTAAAAFGDLRMDGPVGSGDDTAQVKDQAAASAAAASALPAGGRQCGRCGEQPGQLLWCNGCQGIRSAALCARRPTGRLTRASARGCRGRGRLLFETLNSTSAQVGFR
jgi:hypothetical protein